MKVIQEPPFKMKFRGGIPAGFSGRDFLFYISGYSYLLNNCACPCYSPGWFKSIYIRDNHHILPDI